MLALLLVPLPFLVSAALLLWTLTLSPFTAPFVQRSTEEAGRAIRVAMAREVDEAWVATNIDAALAGEDLDRARLTLALAERFDVPVDADRAASVAALEAELTGFWLTAGTCGQCALDIASCPRLDLLAMCGVTVELSPVGDVNALRRAGWAWLRGDEIDRLDAALAVVGLSATALVLATGGSSATIKAGAGLARMARRLGTLTPAFAAQLADLARIDLRAERIWPYLRGRAEIGEVADMARVTALSAVAADLGRVVDRTSLADALALLRHVDGPQDAARLARVADAVGPGTRGAFDILGKGRVFRALIRLTDLALAAAALIYAVALQILMFLAARFGRALWRAFVVVVHGRTRPLPSGVSFGMIAR